ncbi:MAG: hypothetical protein EHM48_05755 [Planctomycetaceae bacterium]|nr:MAG: hypothetical protein EHM48_05755 [Planctomycetaceae bacterium]
MSNIASQETTNSEAAVYQSQIASLNELLRVQEQIIVRQTGKLERMVGRLHNRVSQLKIAEEKLQKYAAELEQANNEVKEFAYIVSHDLRAPLINLKGFTVELRSSLNTVKEAWDAAAGASDSQRQQAGEALTKDIPEAMEFINSSATRMDRLIEAVLKLSRLGRQELVLEKIDMEEIVRGVLKNLGHQIEQHQAVATVKSLPEVVADRTCIEQMMGNILTNAVNYLEPGRPGLIEIGGERQDGNVTIYIRDNGRGIDSRDMPKVFAPFRRAGKQDVPGEGMGMAYVQKIVRRHGGQIRCESVLGTGTTFTITLPEVQTQEQGAEHAKSA